MENTKEDYRNEKKNGASIKGEIEFRNVWLRYNDNGDVLKDISFKIKPGEKIALVGHTGSGKTSIISLISYPRSFIFRAFNNTCTKHMASPLNANMAMFFFINFPPPNT